MILAGLLGLLTWNQAHAYHALETLWKDTLAKNPQSWMAENNLGLFCYEQGPQRQAEAKIHYERALALNPNCASAHQNVGMMLKAEKRYREAITHYREALRINPKCIEAQYNWGNALLELKQYDEAIKRYTEVLQRSPGLAPVYVNLAQALRGLKRNEEAATWLRRVVALDPGYALAHYNLGDTRPAWADRTKPGAA